MLNRLVILIKLPITLNISALFSYDNCELPCSIKLYNETFSMLLLLYLYVEGRAKGMIVDNALQFQQQQLRKYREHCLIH